MSGDDREPERPGVDLETRHEPRAKSRMNIVGGASAFVASMVAFVALALEFGSLTSARWSWIVPIAIGMSTIAGAILGRLFRHMHPAWGTFLGPVLVFCLFALAGVGLWAFDFTIGPPEHAHSDWP